ncbi:MAG TPA: hypothetical protein VGO95_13845 [Modestobacter sp.]|jgi:hypothetical protein|nr:hypothetical protein [Modestobacter sp.]
MSGPGSDWVEQARRFAAGLAAEHAAGTGLTDVLGGLLGPAPDRPAADGAADEHGAECRSCPLCAALAALRGRRPDLLEALADVLAGAATALRSTAGSAAGPGPDAPDVPADVPVPPEETVTHPAPAPTVQRIDVA